MRFWIRWLILLVAAFLLFDNFTVRAALPLTERFLDNTSENLRPKNLELQETDCGFLGLSCLLAPKSNFTQDVRSASEEGGSAGNIFEELAQFFSHIFGQAEGERGYARSYTPKSVLDKSKIGAGEGNELGERDLEETHRDLFHALLPRQFRDDVQIEDSGDFSVESGDTSVESGGTSVERQNRLTYFSQIDPNYQSGSGNITISRCGCGPTSAAMIINGYRDNRANPITVWQDYRNRGYLSVCGTRISENQTVLQGYGFAISAEGRCGSNCLEEINRYLNANPNRAAFILAYLRYGTRENGSTGCVSGGHYFLYTREGIWDPYYGYGKPAPASLNSLKYECQNFRYYFIVELQ